MAGMVIGFGVGIKYHTNHTLGYIFEPPPARVSVFADGSWNMNGTWAMSDLWDMGVVVLTYKAGKNYWNF